MYIIAYDDFNTSFICISIIDQIESPCYCRHKLLQKQTQKQNHLNNLNEQPQVLMETWQRHVYRTY